MARLAVSIFVTGLEQARAAAATAAERGADLVEYRIDTFDADRDDLAALVEQAPLPCIVTCRPDWEGGHYEGDEDARLDRLLHAAAARPAYIDYELAAYTRSPERRERIKQWVDHPTQTQPTDTGLILASHDFDGRPADLFQRVEAMVGSSAGRVIKFAWHARSLRDNLQAFELLAAQHKPTIALCMGAFGLPSRVLAGKFGALLTFAGLDDESVTAPGQVGVATMKRLYRWDEIDAETAVFGVIGWPVAHSMSPAIHNAGFDATGYNGVYLPMPIPPEYEHFKATVGAWLDYEGDPPLNFRGASVTIPHKEHLIRFVRERGGTVEPLAERIGAANTLTVGEDGALHASNTDYAAALDAVCEAMGTNRDGVRGKRVGVIGAGGAARAVVAGFAGCGATVVIYNRTVQRAEQLATEFNGQADEHGNPGGKVVAAPLANLGKSCCEVFINCTPIGMHPNVDASPLDPLPNCVDQNTVVFDTIYNPVETRLLAAAAERGAKTISGVAMFVRQAAAQFEPWTQHAAPTDVFTNVMREQLGTETR